MYYKMYLTSFFKGTLAMWFWHQVITIVTWFWHVCYGWYVCYGWSSVIVINTPADYIKYNTQLKTFEHQLNHYYPYDDGHEFCINHGEKYTAFFERMGTPFINLAMSRDRDAIIGTGIGVLRNIKSVPFPIWYICDLKIAKKWRGYYIPFNMLIKSLVLGLQNYSTRCYAITMNPADKVIKLATRIWTPYGTFKNAGNLLIYSVSATVMQRDAAPIIIHHKGACQYTSLMGIKDLLLRASFCQKLGVPKPRLAPFSAAAPPLRCTCDGSVPSTAAPSPPLHCNNAGTPIKLMHVNHSTPATTTTIEPETTYMFCFHEKDPICAELENVGITTKVSATILHIGMESLLPTQWDFIQTSDI